MYMYVSMCASDTCVNVSMHEYICSHTHTHTHTHIPHIDFHCNTGGVAPTCSYTACSVSGLQIQVVVTINGWGIYYNQRSNTSKGWGFPQERSPPPIPHIILDRAGIYRSHPLSTPWFAPNLNNPGRRPTVYHIHTQQGQQYREKANSIGRKPTV